MFEQQTLHTFSLRDSRNLQQRLCSFIEGCENTRIQGLFLGRVFSLHVQPNIMQLLQKHTNASGHQIHFFQSAFSESAKEQK